MDAAKDMLVLSFCFVTLQSFMLLAESALGSEVNGLILWNSGPLNDLLDCKTPADISRVVCSKILQTRFALKIECLVIELSHCKTVVLLV